MSHCPGNNKNITWGTNTQCQGQFWDRGEMIIHAIITVTATRRWEQRGIRLETTRKPRVFCCRAEGKVCAAPLASFLDEISFCEADHINPTAPFPLNINVQIKLQTLISVVYFRMTAFCALLLLICTCRSIEDRNQFTLESETGHI